MEIISSLGLIVIILLAMNHMAGGRPDNVLRPVGRICSSIVALALTGPDIFLGKIPAKVFDNANNGDFVPLRDLESRI